MTGGMIGIANSLGQMTSTVFGCNTALAGRSSIGAVISYQSLTGWFNRTASVRFYGNSFALIANTSSTKSLSGQPEWTDSASLMGGSVPNATNNYVCCQKGLYYAPCMYTCQLPAIDRSTCIPNYPGSASPSLSTSPSPSSSASSSRSASTSPSASPSNAPYVQQTVQFSATTPAIAISSKVDKTSESTNVASGFYAYNSTTNVSTALPITWQVSQANVTSGSISPDGITSVTSSDGMPVTSTTWQSPKNASIAVATTALYSGLETNVNISIKAPRGLQTLNYTMPPGAIKYTFQLNSTAAQRSLYKNGQNTTISWQACINSTQNLGKFSTGYNTSLSTSSEMVYVWYRSQASLRFDVPLFGIVDNAITRIDHKLVTATLVDEVFTICLEWYLPYFNTSLVYDPTMAALADISHEPNSADTSGDGDGGTSHALAIAVPVSVGVFCVFALLFITIVLLAVYVWRRTHRVKRRRYLTNSGLDRLSAPTVNPFHAK
eukprot:TRINITY_DN5143_c0_g1_i1.p1 TRINITY_DN5143_c0_g1~~TRINITY_DN5143_c0_g1_i1.p1  ORF type:complete len:493 (+),score=40.31 TRINITY_DN5143_c0_g1_i1:19-1497(+)